MKAFRNFVVFEAVFGSALMLSDVADQAPGGVIVGWGIVVASWALVAVLHAFFTDGSADARA